MNKYIIIVVLLCAGLYASAQETLKIKPEKKISLKGLPEPSDISLHPNGNSFFIVSDKGFVFETDLEGNILRKSNHKGVDNEAVFTDENFVYVISEFSRTITLLDIESLEIVRTIRIPYNGGRNSGYEAFTYNKAKGKYVLLTEKNPIYLFELDENLNVFNEININKIARDISAATYYNDHLWLLSDEDMLVMKLNPNTYEVIGKWKLPIINPEGLAFDNQGNMIILSDDMELMYYFKNPETK